MAVNQAQVDHIISTASADDPEVKLLKLQDEVELLKTSIKRLLIDIRERMNDMENPLNVGIQSGSANMGSLGQAEVASAIQGAAGAVQSAAGALKATQQIQEEAAMERREGQGSNQSVQPTGVVISPNGQDTSIAIQSLGNSGNSDETIMAAIRAQFSGISSPGAVSVKESDSAGKVRLQKVFRLFEWTRRNVRKYGHDRVDLMLESYRAMGYISDDSAKLVRDITRLMTTTLGEIHEISADEYVSELYELNHILNPTDVTLDRDMIEVLMEKRGENKKVKTGETGEGELPRQESDSGFMHSKDRI